MKGGGLVFLAGFFFLLWSQISVVWTSCWLRSALSAWRAQQNHCGAWLRCQPLLLFNTFQKKKSTLDRIPNLAAIYRTVFSCMLLASIVVASYNSIYCIKSLQNTLEVPDHCPSVLLLNINFSTWVNWVKIRCFKKGLIFICPKATLLKKNSVTS